MIRASLIWTTYVVLVTEVGTLLTSLDATFISICWALATAILSYVFLRLNMRGHRLPRPTLEWPPTRLDRFLLITIIVIVISILTVALLSSPNTYEVLHYHLSRIAHWAQNRSVAPFATGVEIQNTQAPLAEYIGLQLYVLSRGDLLVNSVQWFAMVMSLLVVSLIAKDLVRGIRPQLVAALFAATLPVGISQASNAETDYVLTFFVAAAYLEAFAIIRRRRQFDTMFFSSLAAGLAILTKPTALVFLLPIAIAAIFRLAFSSPARITLGYAVLALLIVLGLNFGHQARTFKLIGSLGEPSMVKSHLNEQWDLRATTSNILRHASLHAATRNSAVNDIIYRGILKAHLLMDQSPTDIRTTEGSNFYIRPPQTDETDGNTFHALIILIYALILFGTVRRASPDLAAYAFMVLITFVLFAFTNKWQIYGNRYHLAFFVLFAPIFASLPITLRRPNLSAILSVALIAWSLPWVFQLYPRPLLPTRSLASIIQTPRIEQHLQQGGGLFPSIPKCCQLDPRPRMQGSWHHALWSIPSCRVSALALPRRTRVRRSN